MLQMGWKTVTNLSALVLLIVVWLNYAMADLTEPALQCFQCREQGCDTTADCGPRYKNCYKASGVEEGEKFYESGCAEFPECNRNVKGTKHIKDFEKGKEDGSESSESREFRAEEESDENEDLKIEFCELCDEKLCNGQLATIHILSTANVLVACAFVLGSNAILQ